jgi:HK97 family phage prohead protease
MFERGSIAIPSTAKIKLLAQHQANNPIGRAQSFSNEGDFMFGTFKVSASSKGTDYLTLAAEDLISGLSIGCEVTASIPKDDYLLVTGAKLIEVSLVESPAFENATVTKVAASESQAEQEQTNPTTESEAVMTTAPEEAIPAQEAESVEASRPIIATPFNALDTQRVRHGITSPGAMLKHKILAERGNEESRLWITASEDPKYLTAADAFSSAGIGFNPINYMKSIVSTQGNFGRPSFECVSNETMPTFGMTIQRPKFTTYPTVTVEAENGAVEQTDAVSAYLSATVAKYSGMQTISVEMVERSDPGFVDAVMREIQNQLDKVIDKALIDFLVASGTLATAVAATSAGIISFIAEAGPAAYLATGYFATKYLAGTSQWNLLLGATDSTGRPIYSASNPMNNAGDIAITSTKGNVLGLDLFISRNAVSTTIDDSAFVIAPESITAFSSPSAMMSVNVVANLQVQVALYQYAAFMANVGAGVQRFNI